MPWGRGWSRCRASLRRPGRRRRRARPGRRALGAWSRLVNERRCKECRSWSWGSFRVVRKRGSRVSGDMCCECCAWLRPSRRPKTRKRTLAATMLGQDSAPAAEDALTARAGRGTLRRLYRRVARGWRALPLVPLLLMHSGFYFEAWPSRFQAPCTRSAQRMPCPGAVPHMHAPPCAPRAPRPASRPRSLMRCRVLKTGGSWWMSRK